jgi:hypothetical protein
MPENFCLTLAVIRRLEVRSNTCIPIHTDHAYGVRPGKLLPFPQCNLKCAKIGLKRI